MTDFFGNAQARRLLEQTAQTGRFFHAYLFCGEPGLGKKTLARQFAQAALCSGVHKPCGECPSCKKMRAGIHPDYTEYGDEQKQQSISVDQVRELIAQAYIRPNEGDRRVFLLKAADTMLLPAANTLLKILEEPPQGVTLLLTASGRAGVLRTIFSRCVPVELYPVSDADCRAALEQQIPSPDRELLDTACALCGGNIGRALSYAQQPQPVALSGEMEAALTRRDELALLQAVAPLESDARLAAPVLRCFSERLRLALSACCRGEQGGLAGGYTARALTAMSDAVVRAQRLYAHNANPRLTLSRLCADLADC